MNERSVRRILPSQERSKTQTRVARHLVSSPHELAVTEFEQGLICAAEAFYRFYGVLLGREGRHYNLSGYSLKKLMRAGLIEKAAKGSARETSYRATELARNRTREFLLLRRELFTDPSAQILNFDQQLETCAKLMNTIAGFYDHGARVMASREQTAEDAAASHSGSPHPRNDRRSAVPIGSG